MKLGQADIKINKINNCIWTHELWSVMRKRRNDGEDVEELCSPLLQRLPSLPSRVHVESDWRSPSSAPVCTRGPVRAAAVTSKSPPGASAATPEAH